MRMVVSPYSGRPFDYDTLPGFDPVIQKPGKFCPDTHKPLDATALKNFSHGIVDPIAAAAYMAYLQTVIDEVEAALNE